MWTTKIELLIDPNTSLRCHGLEEHPEYALSLLTERQFYVVSQIMDAVLNVTAH
jgi:hypothetical protein